MMPIIRPKRMARTRRAVTIWTVEPIACGQDLGHGTCRGTDTEVALVANGMRHFATPPSHSCPAHGDAGTIEV